MPISDDPTLLLRTCFAADEWVALLTKSASRGKVSQRIGSRDWVCSEALGPSLLARNRLGEDVYVGVNPMVAGTGTRRRADVALVRHVFLDVDENLEGVLRRINGRSELPTPSYVVHTSPGRAHVLWRIRDLDAPGAERLQKRLAADLGGDAAATSVTQLTRLPGFRNLKHREPYVVWVEYRGIEHVYTPRDFPSVGGPHSAPPESAEANWSALGYGSPAKRARAYLSHVPPAVAGDNGDLHTFQTCCRLVRGFALDDDQALTVLSDWNARCQPPWTERELLQKIRSARRNGREPIGGLL